jgi:hypothetical protein
VSIVPKLAEPVINPRENQSGGLTTFRGGKTNKSALGTGGKSRTVFSMVQSSKRTEMERLEKERQEKEKIEKEQRRQLGNIPRLRKKDKLDLRNELIRQHEDNCDQFRLINSFAVKEASLKQAVPL